MGFKGRDQICFVVFSTVLVTITTYVFLCMHLQGAKQLYRVAVHPFLMKREAQIDAGISKLGSTGLNALRRVSKEGLSMAAAVVITTAMKVRGGGSGAVIRENV